MFDTSTDVFKDYYRNKGIIPKSFTISEVSDVNVNVTNNYCIYIVYYGRTMVLHVL